MEIEDSQALDKVPSSCCHSHGDGHPRLGPLALYVHLPYLNEPTVQNLLHIASLYRPRLSSYVSKAGFSSHLAKFTSVSLYEAKTRTWDLIIVEKERYYSSATWPLNSSPNLLLL